GCLLQLRYLLHQCWERSVHESAIDDVEQVGGEDVVVDECLLRADRCCLATNGPPQQRVFTKASPPGTRAETEPEALRRLGVEATDGVECRPPVEDVARWIEPLVPRRRAALERLG